MPDLDLIRAFRDDVADDPAAEAAARDRLRTHMAAGGRRRRRPGRRAGVTLCAVLLVSGTAAAAGVLLTNDDVHLDAVACLDTARTIDSDAPGRVVSVEPSADPVAACAAVWRAGDMDGRRHAAAPGLVACAAAGEPVAVVPGRSGTCAALGLAPLPEGFADAAAATGKAKAVLWREGDLHRPRSACDDPTAVLARSRQLLADAGIPDYPVELSGKGECAGVVDFEAGAVARIELISRAAAARYRERRLVSLALDPLFDAREGCAGPQAVTARARALLDAADLAGVRIRIEPDGGPCVETGSFAFGKHAVVFSRRAR